MLCFKFHENRPVNEKNYPPGAPSPLPPPPIKIKFVISCAIMMKLKK